MEKIDNKTNNTKMIKTDPETIDLLSKIKGWHLQHGRRATHSTIVKDLILKDAKRKGLDNGC